VENLYLSNGTNKCISNIRETIPLKRVKPNSLMQKELMLYLVHVPVHKHVKISVSQFYQHLFNWKKVS
jgi:hypothetical protein